MESSDPILDRARLDAVDLILSSHGTTDPEFDRLTRLAARMLKVPICLVSLVTDERQEFKGACGLPDEIEAVRGTPLSFSICQLTVKTGEVIVVENAEEDPRTSENPVLAIGLRSYLGFPLMNAEGLILGAFCAIDYVPRKWTEDEIDTVRDFAGLAVELIESAAKSARIGAAFDIVLHDLRSPLSGMLMATSLFREQIDRMPAHFHPLVHMVGDSTNAAVNLVECLSDRDQRRVARCEEPDKVLEDVAERLRPAAMAKDIVLQLEIGALGPLAVPTGRWSNCWKI